MAASTSLQVAGSLQLARFGLRRPSVTPRSTRSNACKPASSLAPTAFSSPAARPSPRSARRRSKSSTPMLHRLPAAMPRLALQSLLLAATAAAAAVFAGAGAAGAAFAAGSGSEPGAPRNVYGGELGLCSTSPMTGYFRDGRCDTGPMDYGTHTVCAKVTNEFLQYTLQQGNDLITPRPEYRFPGLKEGDGWCLCAARWREALAAGVAPPVVLKASHSKTLQFVELSELERHAAGTSGSTATQ